MKILCVSDETDSLVYSGQIKSRFADIDLVLGAGDLDLDYYGFIVSSLNKPLLFVFGNHNLTYLPDYRRGFGEEATNRRREERSFGAVEISGKIKHVRGLIIAGLGGSMRYNDGQNQYSEFGMFLHCLGLLPSLLFNRIFYGRYLDILLTHAAPRGIQDGQDRAHRGFQVFIWFMKLFRPTYLVHGHIHLYDINAKRVTQFAATRVVNAFEHVVIDTEGAP